MSSSPPLISITGPRKRATGRRTDTGTGRPSRVHALIAALAGLGRQRPVIRAVGECRGRRGHHAVDQARPVARDEHLGLGPPRPAVNPHSPWIHVGLGPQPADRSREVRERDVLQRAGQARLVEVGERQRGNTVRRHQSGRGDRVRDRRPPNRPTARRRAGGRRPAGGSTRPRTRPPRASSGERRRRSAREQLGEVRGPERPSAGVHGQRRDRPVHRRRRRRACAAALTTATPSPTPRDRCPIPARCAPDSRPRRGRRGRWRSPSTCR